MMRKITDCLIIVSILAWPSMGLAIDFTNGAWSTSFDYSEPCFGGGQGGTDCSTVADDGVSWANTGLNGVDGNYTQASSAANNPNGSGGYGARFWAGDGTNVQSRAVTVHFSTQQPELWLRWYMRYESGFTWASYPVHYDKWLYMRCGTDDTIANSQMEIIVGESWGVKAYIQGNSDGHQIPGPTTWVDVFGQPSDGLWHMIEVYIKLDTDSTDGIYRMWVDGQVITEKTDVDYSNGNAVVRAGVKWFDFTSNQNSPANGKAMYVDYDDMAIYNTDPGNRDDNGNPWIGPLNGFSGAGSSPRPMPPVVSGF